MENLTQLKNLVGEAMEKKKKIGICLTGERFSTYSFIVPCRSDFNNRICIEDENNMALDIQNISDIQISYNEIDDEYEILLENNLSVLISSI